SHNVQHAALGAGGAARRNFGDRSCPGAVSRKPGCIHRGRSSRGGDDGLRARCCDRERRQAPGSGDGRRTRTIDTQQGLVILSEAKDLCNWPAALRRRQVALVLRFAQDDSTDSQAWLHSISKLTYCNPPSRSTCNTTASPVFRTFTALRSVSMESIGVVLSR